MPHTHLLLQAAAREKVLRGATALADAVRITLGPKSKSVLIGKRWGRPLVCNDGVTIAKELDLEDPEERLGAQVIREAAERTGEAVGDGTTTATLLAHAIFADGVRNVTAGASAVDLRRGLERGLKVAVAAIQGLSRPVQTTREKEQIAAVSAHNDTAIGQLVAQAIERVGSEGVVTVEEAKGTETALDVVEGNVDRAARARAGAGRRTGGGDMTTILVPLDGSPLAEQALTLAEQLARALRAKLRLALVHEPAAVTTGPVARAQMALHRVEREYLSRVRARLKTQGFTDVTAVVLKGDPREELTRYADERDPDLVVLASHGRGGLARAWFGSVAEHLVRHVAAPVVVVPAREHAADAPPLDQIMVALDGSKAAQAVLDPAVDLGRALGAELLLCRVVQPVPLPSDPILPVSLAYDTDLTDRLVRDADGALAEVAERLVDRGVPVKRRTVIGHGVAATLIEAMRDEGTGLVVMTTRARGGLGRLGSVADKVMRGAPCPVLLFRRRKG